MVYYDKETYEYFLQHGSNQINTENLVRELKLHKELYTRHSDYIKNLVGDNFDIVIWLKTYENWSIYLFEWFNFII